MPDKRIYRLVTRTMLFVHSLGIPRWVQLSIAAGLYVVFNLTADLNGGSGWPMWGAIIVHCSCGASVIMYALVSRYTQDMADFKRQVYPNPLAWSWYGATFRVAGWLVFLVCFALLFVDGSVLYVLGGFTGLLAFYLMCAPTYPTY